VQIVPAPARSGRLSKSRTGAVQEALVAWYRANARDLPWRRTRDPYAIVVSELMLQQQTVRHVTPVYRSFLERFPDLRALASASLAEVIRTWQPLGRYSSAVRLQGIARHLLAERGGEVPGTVDALLQLGGVGRYTAGAIACFAFGQRAPLVDTNVRRVLVRLTGVELPPGAAAERRVWELATALLPASTPYEWNQGLLDLGAAVCIARRPRCESCPLTSWCDFHRRGGGGGGGGGGAQKALAAARRTAPAARERVVAEARGAYAAAPAPDAGGRGAPGTRLTPRFEGSRRWYRGQIMQALCALPPGASLAVDDLVRRLARTGFAPDAALLESLLGALRRDGLLCRETGEDGATWLALPEGGAGG
jgi:A/G-specific adenine glycosylase